MYPNLMAELGRSGMTKKELSQRTEIYRNTLCNKLNGGEEFTLREMRRIRDSIPTAKDRSLDYLFAYKKDESLDPKKRWSGYDNREEEGL